MEHSIYLNGLKKALKAKGVTYTELAETLRMTESGVKKMLNAKDISFRRVLQICDALDILPGQLFSLSERSSIEEVTLSPAQQDALLKSRNLLAVYWRITIEHCDLSEIEKLQHLSHVELKKLLDRLVSLDLLVHRKGEYKARHHGKFRWPDDSKIARALNREWSELTLSRSLEKGQGLHRLAVLRFSKEAHQGLLKKISTVIDEAVQESEREELTLARSSLHNTTVLVAITDKGVFDSF